MPHTVTVGLDGSATSRAAAEWAAQEALLAGRPLRLLHATTAGAPVGARGGPARPAPARRGAVDLAVDETRADLSRRHPGLRTVSEQVAQDPATALVSVAGPGDLLVLGARGRGARRGLPLGSVALAVTARAPGPVVVVRAEEEDRREAGGRGAVPGERRPAAHEPQPPTGKGDVVVGLDVHRPHEDLLRFAFGAALRRGAGVLVLHGWRTPPYASLAHASGPSRTELTAELTREALEKLDHVLATWRERHPGVKVREAAVPRNAARHLVAASQDAALLVVGRRRAPNRTHLGPVGHAVLHYAMAPVAVVPHD
ncbi:universal stress protein [Streptomyces sp. NPDC007088]|uniref:universal stress protein n=1 Tax=Streptomyces sp. NPDC007088 TaxID=3364773 RepID=UPI003690AF0B